jgi:preprotein translocase subunit Sec63
MQKFQLEKEQSKFLATSVNKRLAKVSDSPKRRKFGQSGHPDGAQLISESEGCGIRRRGQIKDN